MKQTSAGSSARGIGSIQCPFCHVPLVRIQSKQRDTKGQWFLKWPYNIYGDPTTCGYICPEMPVVKFEAQEDQLKATQEASCDCCYQLKSEFEVLKQTLDSVVSELSRLNVKPAEPIHEPKAVAKQIVIDYSVFVGFIGVLIGVVVACMWK